MKAFWAILVALIVAGAAYVVLAARSGQGSSPTAQLTAGTPNQTETAPQQAAPPANAITSADLEALKKQQDDLRAQLAKAKEDAAKLEAPAPTPKPDSKPVPNPDPAPLVTLTDSDPADDAAPKPEDAKPADAKPAETRPADAKPADKPAPPSNDGYSITGGGVAPPGVTGTPATPVPAAEKPASPNADSKAGPKPDAAKPEATKPLKFQGFEVIPAKIETKDDGSMLVDGKYVIKGDGTADKPYIVPWDVLTSVEETFDPQSAKKRLPQRITMLDGKVVKLSGYIAFPLAIKETKECLSMLNQWDGCCIGVPPTPYDAVEVALTRTIKGEERFTTAGSVTGTFRVKPYLQGDWLIGLYVMEGADLKSRDYGGPAGS